MSEIKHSPEPWGHFDNGFDGGIVSLADGQRNKFIFGGEPFEGRVEADDPDVRRAIACVNACAGIPTEVLEQEAWRALMRGLEKLADLDDPRVGFIGAAIMAFGRGDPEGALRALGRLP